MPRVRRYGISVVLITSAICSVALTAGGMSPRVKLVFLETIFDGDGGIVDGLQGAHSVAASPDGRHVYVAANMDDAVVVFARNSATGALTFVEVERDGVGDADGLDGANAVTVSPDGKHVYVAGGEEDAVAVFSRHDSTGGLTFDEVERDGVDGVNGLDGAASVAVSPDGYYLYAAGFDDNAVAVFERHPASGALHFVEMKGSETSGLVGPRSVVVSPDGKNLYVSGAMGKTVVVFSRNVSTGRLAWMETHEDGVNGVDGLTQPESLVVSPDGESLYCASRSEEVIAVFARNATTGALTFVEAEGDGLKGSWWLTSVAVSPDGEHVYVTGADYHTVRLFSRNSGNGSLTFVDVVKNNDGGVQGLDSPVAVAASPDGRHIYVANWAGNSVAAFLVSRMGLFKADLPDDFSITRSPAGH